MRSIAHQSVEELGGSSSVLVRQRMDHVALDGLLNQLEASRGDEQQAVLTRLSRLVFPHAFAEEAVLWPAVRRCLPQGEGLTLRVEEEHQEINELFARLESAPVDGPDHDGLIERVTSLLRQDVRDEEDDLLPRLQERLGVEDLRRLGRRWEVVRRVAPTRHHPVVARRPPGNVLAALPLTIVDRTRDRLDQAAHRTGGAPSKAFRAVSSGLGRAGRRIERLPLLRRGERPATHLHPGEGRP